MGNYNNQPHDMIQANITTTEMQLIGDEGKEEILIPEAFLVEEEDEEVFMATPLGGSSDVQRLCLV